MKIVFGALLVAGSLFANNGFTMDKDYTCINTHVLKDDKKIDVNPQMAKERPFDFKLTKDKIISTEKTEFKFMMAKEDMKSYANKEFMLLLTKGQKLGLVPKASQGKLQYYFQCKAK